MVATMLTVAMKILKMVTMSMMVTMCVCVTFSEEPYTMSMIATMVAMVVPEVMAVTRLGVRLITRYKMACQRPWTAAWLMIAVNTRRWVTMVSGRFW